MDKDQAALDRMRHVNSHLTPMAVVIVAPALFLAPVSKAVALTGAALLAYSLLLNFLTLSWARHHAERTRKLRVFSNYAVNIILLWLFYPVWPTMWLLLLLMSVGVAYQTRRAEIVSGAVFAAMLLAVHLIMGERSLTATVQAATQAALIFAFSLFTGAIGRLPQRQLSRST